MSALCPCVSRRARAKLDRLHTILTSGGHYGTGASPATSSIARTSYACCGWSTNTGQPSNRPARSVRPGTGQPVLHHRPAAGPLLRRLCRRGRLRCLHCRLRRADERGSLLRPRVLRRWAGPPLRPAGVGADRRTAHQHRRLLPRAERCRCSTRRSIPATVARLVLLTTTVDGDVQGGIPWVAHRMGLAGESYDNPRLVPAARGEELVRDAGARVQQHGRQNQRPLGSA